MTLPGGDAARIARPASRDLLVVAGAKLAVGLVVLVAGFYALSDDDFSRVVVAQRFAVAPRLDPSGTSWLPLPFWLTGTAMLAFGRTLAVARGVALVSSVLAALLVHRAARWAGASPRGAVLGTLAATSLPTAARLGVSFQPEALTAALVVLGAASVHPEAGRVRRIAGAVALLAACLCRYEAWAGAAVVGGLCLADGVRRRAGESTTWMDRLACFGAAGLCVAAPLAWALHGVAAHGDALFFLHRVAAYRRALGGNETALAGLLAYPWALLRAEPEATLFGFAAIAYAARRSGWSAAGSLMRPVLVIAGVFVFLVVGQLLDGAPTHHVERTLLPVWTALLLIATEVTLRTPFEPSRRVTRTLLGIALAGIVIRVVRPTELSATRAAERAVGAEARRRAPEGARLAIDTDDYGYFAVMAAFEAPERAVALDDHDPRSLHRERPFGSPAALRARLTELDAAWLVVRSENLPVAERVGRLEARTEQFALLQALQ